MDTMGSSGDEARVGTMGLATVKLQSTVCLVKSTSPAPEITPLGVCRLED
jgi:hypothetical protein